MCIIMYIFINSWLVFSSCLYERLELPCPYDGSWGICKPSVMVHFQLQDLYICRELCRNTLAPIYTYIHSRVRPVYSLSGRLYGSTLYMRCYTTNGCSIFTAPPSQMESLLEKKSSADPMQPDGTPSITYPYLQRDMFR